MRPEQFQELINSFRGVELNPEEFKQIVSFLATRVRIFPKLKEKNDFMNFYNILEYYAAKPS